MSENSGRGCHRWNLQRSPQRIFAIIVAAAVAGKVAAADDPAASGPYGVGVETVEYVDSSRSSRRLITEIWYPTTEKGTRWTYPSGAHSSAKRGAAVADGTFPLVLFSHGNFAVREQTTFLTEHIATHGYIVAAVDHQFNTRRDYVVAETVPSGEHRPRDLSFVIDQLEKRRAQADDPLTRAIDLDRIAATGTSYGGYTALAVAGAGVQDLRKTSKEGQKAETVNLRDARIDCAIAYAPLVRPALLAEGLSCLDRPVLVFCGTRDSLTPHRVHHIPLLSELGGKRYLATIEGATHFNFENEETITGTKSWAHQPTIDRADADRIIRRLTIAFLDRYLKENERHAALLLPRRETLLSVQLAGE